jgi:hypothetical protein
LCQRFDAASVKRPLVLWNFKLRQYRAALGGGPGRKDRYDRIGVYFGLPNVSGVSAMPSAAMKTAAMKTAAMKTAAMKTATMKTATMEAAGMEGPAVEAAGMEATMKDVAAMETAAMEAASDAANAPRKVVPVIRIVVITGWCVVAGLVLVVVLNGRIGLRRRWL